MEFDKAKDYILDRLRVELPQHLYYHCYEHTLDVYDAAEKICKYHEISDHETSLILTAVLFHDCGFINVYDNHEVEGCRIASEALPGFGYSASEISHINDMIMATKIPQTPLDFSGEIICDADLDYLGRDDFKPIAKNLFLELQQMGKLTDINVWNTIQVKFLSSHTYFTEYGRTMRLPKKMLHLEELKKITGLA